MVDAATALTDFDGISYAKGASALRQLAVHLGDEVFFDGLRAHFAKHSYGNAEFADLIGAWTAAGAEDLDEWARMAAHQRPGLPAGWCPRWRADRPADRAG